MALESRGLARSRNKLKKSYFHYNGAYHYQTLQGGEVPWGAPRHKVTWPFVQAVKSKIKYQYI